MTRRRCSVLLVRSSGPTPVPSSGTWAKVCFYGRNQIVSLKVHVGSYNRSFLLGFNNGTFATAKFPFSFPGHTAFRTASEVATLRFLEAAGIGIRIPKVLAWASSPAATAVGAQFILLEYMPGVSLDRHWDNVRGLATGETLQSVVKAEMELMDSLQFSGIGSIYFKEDVPPDVQRPLFASDHDAGHLKSLGDTYCLGPLVNRYETGLSHAIYVSRFLQATLARTACETCVRSRTL